MKNPPLNPNEWERGTEIRSIILGANGDEVSLAIRPEDLKYMGTPFAAFLSHLIHTTEGFKLLGEGNTLLRTVRQVGTQTNGFPLLEIICDGKDEPLAKPTSPLELKPATNNQGFLLDECVMAIHLSFDIRHHIDRGLPLDLAEKVLKEHLEWVEIKKRAS